MKDTKESANVITIPHGGITAEQLQDACKTLRGLLDIVESRGLDNAVITQDQAQAIRLLSANTQGNGDESSVITIPHGGITGEGSSS